MRRYAALFVAIALLSGCAPDAPRDESDPGPGAARVAVDTPQLRKLKQEAGVEPCAPGDAAPVEGGLPDVTLACLGGGQDVNLSSLRGPMVINLWAVWCGPCRAEMPILQSFHERYGDRVPMLGIDYQDPQTTAALDLVRETGVTYPLLADPQSALDGAEPIWPLRGLPFLVLVDEAGRLVWQQFVAIESLDQLVGLVNEHLGADL